MSWIRKLTAVGLVSSAVVAGTKLYRDKRCQIETNKLLRDEAVKLREEPTIAKSQSDYSLWLAKHVLTTTDAKDKNFVFSPFSIHCALSMVTAGSSGRTRAQLLDHLKSNSVQELNSLSSQVAMLLFADGGPGARLFSHDGEPAEKENTEAESRPYKKAIAESRPHLSSVNGVWVDQTLTLKPSFKEIIDNCYKATSNHVDFFNKANEVREEVNAWAEKKTNGLIKDILPPESVNSETRLILANTLYFKGTWVEEFEKSLTKDADFFLANQTSVRAPFMTSGKQQCVRAFDGFKVLRLPYRRGFDKQLSMYVYLPDARDGLPSLIEKFGSVSGFIEKHLPYKEVRVGDFRIPKFKINSSIVASEVLKGQGLDLPFVPGSLTEMVEGDEGLHISEIYHKSCIEVDEKGTEAAAVTVLAMVGCCGIMAEEKAVDFVADHAFLFVVREDVSGCVLFVGQVVNPNA